MNGRGMSRARFVCVPALLGLSFSAQSAAPASGPGDLARCAAIDAPDQRLACYDTLAGRPPDRGAPALSAAPAATSSPGVAAVSAPAQLSVAAQTPASTANDPRNFGLSAAQLHPTPPSAPSAVQAHVTQIIQSVTGFGRPILVLDNGQTWIFTEAPDDSRLASGDEVTIKRAALGSFLLTTPSHHSYHVHRLQ